MIQQYGLSVLNYSANPVGMSTEPFACFRSSGLSTPVQASLSLRSAFLLQYSYLRRLQAPLEISPWAKRRTENPAHTTLIGQQVGLTGRVCETVSHAALPHRHRQGRTKSRRQGLSLQTHEQALTSTKAAVASVSDEACARQRWSEVRHGSDREPTRRPNQQARLFLRSELFNAHLYHKASSRHRTRGRTRWGQEVNP